MVLKQIIEINDIIDRADASGNMVKEYLESYGGKDIQVKKVKGNKGSTDFVKVKIPGLKGKSKGKDAPTIGIIGRLGGIGARPEITGMVSDADGAVTAMAAAARILDMQNKGDYLDGDVILCTHICPDAPTQPHEPVPFMDSPVEMSVINKMEVDDEMDAILSVDTTKGNSIINTRGFAVSPTVKDGYILKVSSDILNIMQITTGRLPYVFALSLQDITPYGNGLYHMNSILQPATATSAPVVGVAITTESSVSGCATGAIHFGDVEETARFVIEVAKAYGKRQCSFFDEDELNIMESKYGFMKHFQTLGK